LGVLLATAGIYAVWSLVAGQHGILEIWAQGRREAEVRAEIAETEQRLAELDRQLEDIELAIEAKARTEYGFSEPNELIFVDSTAVGVRRGGNFTVPGRRDSRRP
jgi:cell division protein FtsB